MKTHAYQAIHWIEEYCVTPDTPDSLFFCRRAAAFAPPRFRLARAGEDYQAGQEPQHAADLWQTATRMQATLASRLRLAPQARTDPKTVGIRQHAQQQPRGPRQPWDWK